nr:hypothetical protein [Paraburkholderia azotifigens]
MKVLPHRCSRQRRRGVDVGVSACCGECLPDLLAQRQLGAVREPDHDGQVQIFAQARKESRVQQRRFPEARAAEQDGQHFAAHQPGQFIGLARAATEEVLVCLGERGEARPRTRRRQVFA